MPRYAVPGTDRPATRLRARYAVSGTELGYGVVGVPEADILSMAEQVRGRGRGGERRGGRGDGGRIEEGGGEGGGG